MQSERNEGGVKYYLQPGNRMIYGLSLHGLNVDAPLDSSKSLEDKQGKNLKVTKIDVTDEGSIWNKLPTSTTGFEIDFWFRNYIPPNITIVNPETDLSESYYFGCMIQRNAIDSISDHIYKFYNWGTVTQPLYVIESLDQRLEKHRLNYGICSFKLNGKIKIMLLGGNKGKARIKSIEDAANSLYDSCLLFDVETEKFETDFQLTLNSPKDNVTAVWVGDNFVYSFFGRTARQVQQTENNYDETCIKLPKYQYSQTVERWKISDDSDRNSFVEINVRFDDGVSQCLKPWIVPIQYDSTTKFIVVGGVAGNQSPIKQVWVLEIDEANIDTFKYKDNEDEVETSEASLVFSFDFTKKFEVALSFSSCNTLISDGSYYSIGMNCSGRPWAMKYDALGQFEQNPILN